MFVPVSYGFEMWKLNKRDYRRLFALEIIWTRPRYERHRKSSSGREETIVDKLRQDGCCGSITWCELKTSDGRRECGSGFQMKKRKRQRPLRNWYQGVLTNSRREENGWTRWGRKMRSEQSTGRRRKINIIWITTFFFFSSTLRLVGNLSAYLHP